MLVSKKKDSRKRKKRSNRSWTTDPVFCSFADQFFWICIDVRQPGATSFTPGKVFYQCVTPDLFNIQWSKICFKSGTINNSFSRNCSIRKWQLIREQLLRRPYLIQFGISHEINLAENTMKLYSGSLILTYVLWCSRYDKKWALASTTGTAPSTTTPIIKNLIGWARTTNCNARAASYLEQFRAVLCKDNNKKKKQIKKLQQLEITIFKAMITTWAFNGMCERTKVWL